jgi:hypothetical protein
VEAVLTDPWAYARELRAKNTLELTEETAMLLSDADALLAVKETMEYLSKIEEHVTLDTVRIYAREAIAALPEHLKAP